MRADAGPGRAPPPPGEILLEEWRKPMKLTQLGLAKKMGVDIQLLNGVVKGRRASDGKDCATPASS